MEIWNQGHTLKRSSSFALVHILHLKCFFLLGKKTSCPHLSSSKHKRYVTFLLLLVANMECRTKLHHPTYPIPFHTGFILVWCLVLYWHSVYILIPYWILYWYCSRMVLVWGSVPRWHILVAKASCKIILPLSEQSFSDLWSFLHLLYDCYLQIATRMVIQYGWGPDDSPAIYISSKAVCINSQRPKFHLSLSLYIYEKHIQHCFLFFVSNIVMDLHALCFIYNFAME